MNGTRPKQILRDFQVKNHSRFNSGMIFYLKVPKAKPNRFAPQDPRSKMTVIVLDEDIAQVFPTSEGV